MSCGGGAVFMSLKAILNVILHQCVAVIVVYSVWAAYAQYTAEYGYLSWHVVLCTIGIFPLMAEAFILYSDDNVWSIELERSTRHYIHGVLMLLGSTSIISGVVLEMCKHHWTSGGHFSSTHAIFGLVSFLFIILSLVFGIMAHFAKQLKGYAPPNHFHLIHNSIGIFTFLMCIVSLCTGYFTLFFQTHNSEASRVAATILTCITCLWTLIFAIISLVKQIRRMI